MLKYYAGIGSRSTPKNILHLMRHVAKSLACRGYILRSGGARGADKAFESGCLGKKEIFTAKDATYRSVYHAELFHPNWDRVSPYAKLLLARNSQIVLGENLDKPVEFVVCYTPDAQVVGGTGQALRVAKGYQIPIHNLGDPEQVRLVEDHLEDHAKTCEFCRD